MLSVVKRVWRRVQEIVPGIGPIQWLCHPETARQTCALAGAGQPELQLPEYAAGADLMKRLLCADMAIVPFNAIREPHNYIERYSLPSRLTELLSVGLPVFSIAGEGTPLARYLAKNGLGPACDAEDEVRLARELVAFILDRDERLAVGLRERAFAEREFPLRPFQDYLYATLERLATSRTQA
jgi:hypothetical protein